VPRLVHRVKVAGLPVTYTEEGVVREVPAGVGLSAYRIVQEGLTNTMKHAGPGATARVTVHYGRFAVEVRVEDDGVGLNGRKPFDGNGLRGMRERTSMLGGTLQVGASSPGNGASQRGYLVWARLPT
jgi:signal transduction histidine kinase